MRRTPLSTPGRVLRIATTIVSPIILLSCGPGAQPAPSTAPTQREAALTPVAVTVRGADGTAVSGYRWTLEEDLTYHVQPGVPDPDTVSVGFHRSYMPVVSTGSSSPGFGGVPDPTKHYFLSVLPDEGYSMGGAAIAPGQSAVTIYVNKHPLPTAQATIFVFEDNAPINGTADLPQEQGLAGFHVFLEEAGGRYGQSGGQQMMDGFGNPLGTTYLPGTTTVDMMGQGFALTDESGRANIKNLSPGKYAVKIIPPAGTDWSQTSTIEGTKGNDIWVKPNEPGFFQEFGPPGYHAFFGFVRPMKDATVLSGGSTISGQITNLHMSRPPGPFYSSATVKHTRAWIGLNAGPAGAGRAAFVKKADAEGRFAIPDVPPGGYELVVWDEALDFIIATHSVTVNTDGSCSSASTSCNLGQVPVFQWFHRHEHQVFYDKNGNGFRDDGEPGIPEQAINIRWRDGTIFQSAGTDGAGVVTFDEIFPFFAWQIAEVDFARLKATGVTVTVDDGGPVNPNDPWSSGGDLTPQPQSENGGLPYRTEQGPALLEAFQGFIGQKAVFQWGKKEYEPGENGGISGVVRYATTRAENDPRFAAAENWEPGIPGVTVRLYDETGTTLLNEVQTDSWDASPPTGCQGPTFTFRGSVKDCFDGMKNWNQVRPGVFDGGYAFWSYWPEGFNNGSEVQGLPAGTYVVEVVPPPGYEIVKEEDRNVDFGDTFAPSTQQLPPDCVGTRSAPVPDDFSLFKLTDDNGDPVKPFRAGESPPLCDRKRVKLSDRQNAAADFSLFTPVPVASHIVGFVLDDAANEFDPNAPTFGEKYAPPWLPISVRDWTGREIAHSYTDEYGVYNLLVPSTYTADRAAPSGMSPNMLTVCVNSPTKADPTGASGYVLDTFYNPQYSQFCYTFQFMPGVTTYLDTPVVPVAAFAGPNQYPLDCEFSTGTPRVYSVTGPQSNGPWIPVPTSGNRPAITIVAPSPATGGKIQVANPAYDGTNDKTIERDFGFGSAGGTVKIGSSTLTVTSWTPGMIVATAPPGTVTGQLSVKRNDTGLSTINAVTVTVGTAQPVYALKSGETIQHAIDIATPGTTILVPPGFYDELVIMWKPVRLQGWGEGTQINAYKVPAEKLQAWRTRVAALAASNSFTLLPGQAPAANAPAEAGVEPALLADAEGPGVIVLARDRSRAAGGFGLYPASQGGLPNARIDGLTITGGDTAGAIVVNGYAHYLQISNTRLVGNSGALSGGIRLGHAALTAEQGNSLIYPDAHNDNIAIQYNQIARNGGLGGAGGGVSLYTGSNNYRVAQNFICGNFSPGGGAGIGHLGLSPGGLIEKNTIAFNESFEQTTTTSGGGILISGAAPLAGSTLSPGAGSTKILGNQIIGNSAGAGDGGGIALVRVTGDDLNQGQRGLPKHEALLVDNIIANNVAGLAGGGIALQDAALTRILHNTVANNDSTATAGAAFAPGSPNRSTAQPAGIVARGHSAELLAALAAGQPPFSSPELINSIVRHNRSFYFLVDPALPAPGFGLRPDPSSPEYWDLGVIGAAGSITAQSCITSASPTDPMFVAEYFNGARGETIIQPGGTTALQAPPAFDEGGNFIRVGFGPLTLFDPNTLLRLGDYHLQAGSPARAQGQAISSPAEVLVDIDGEARPLPSNTRPDVGADERL